MQKESVSIFWFRNDLRIADNPGLVEAAKHAKILVIYIYDVKSGNPHVMGEASNWWLNKSLQNLNKNLKYKLNFYLGDSETVLKRLIKEYDVSNVYWNRCYEPYYLQRDAKIEANLEELVEINTFNASLLWDPKDIRKDDGTSYKVYSAFYNKCKSHPSTPRVPLKAPHNLNLIKDDKNSTTIEKLELLSKIKWYNKIEEYWDIGEENAKNNLNEFLDHKLKNYKLGRNFPGKGCHSRLSPHLHFGELSPNQVWYSAQSQGHINNCHSDSEHFLREIAWREFSYYLLYHFPELPIKNFNSQFDNFPWQYDKKLFDAWKQGQTGFPIIDAGMRELWQTGFMHNRVRMIVASFLIKNLLQDWRKGAEWFWDCLVDGDLANNSGNWQWVAGSGADAAPYYRIFNPILQGEKFDTEGEYTLKFVPELSKLSKKYLYKPWEAPEDILKQAGIKLGKTYPHPIVDLKQSREKALEAYHSIKSTNY